MELIYRTRRKTLNYEPPHYSSMYDTVRPVITISPANIISFSSVTELSDVEGDTWGGHVYVCDLDTPWDAHKVCSTINHVSSLSWDCEGRQLLVATIEGEVSIYSQKDYLINEWSCVTNVHFPGEHIVRSIYFDTGRRVTYIEKPDAPVSERIQVTNTPPTWKGFGGAPVGGWWVVSMSGRVGAVSGGRVTSATLTPHTHTHTAVDIKLHKTGSAVVCLGGKEGYVRVSSVSISPDFDLRVTPWPTLYLLAAPQGGAPMSLSWYPCDEGDSILVGGQTLSQWKLSEKSYPVHKLLSSTNPSGGPKTENECFKTLVWQMSESWPLEGGEARGHSHTLTHTNTHLHYLSHGHLTTVQVLPAPFSTLDGATSAKQTKYDTEQSSGSVRISSCSVTSLGGVAVTLDTRSQLAVYSLPLHVGEPGSPARVQSLVSLLEYSLVTGYDAIDIIMTTKPHHRQLLFDRVTECFPRHSQMFQQYYYHRWMALRLLLCRCTPNMEYGASVLSSLLCVMSLAHTLRHEDPDDDKGEHKSEPIPLSQWAGLRDVARRAQDIANTALANISSNNDVEMHCERGGLWWCACAGRDEGERQRGEVERRVAHTLTSICCLRPHPPTIELIEECNSLVSSLQSSRVWDSAPRTCVSAPVARLQPLVLEYGVEPPLRYCPDPPQNWEVITNDTRDSISLIYLGGRRWRQCGRCGAKTVTPHQPIEERYRLQCRCGGRWTMTLNEKLNEDCD